MVDGAHAEINAKTRRLILTALALHEKQKARICSYGSYRRKRADQIHYTVGTHIISSPPPCDLHLPNRGSDSPARPFLVSSERPASHLALAPTRVSPFRLPEALTLAGSLAYNTR